MVHHDSPLHALTVHGLPSSQSPSSWQQVLPAEQQVPLTQFPEMQSAPVVHDPPSTFFGRQMPPEQ